MPIRIVPDIKADDRHPRGKWITKKKPTNWITKKPTIKSTLTGTDTTRGGGPDSGNVGYNKDFIYRAGKHRKKWREEMEKRKRKRMGESRAAPKKIKIDSNIVKTKNWPFAKGGDVTRFRSSGPEGKPHSTKEGRSAEAQRAYIRKFGPQEPRRKTLAVTDKYKEAREKLKDHGGFKPLRASKARGGKAGTGPTPGQRIKARKARAEEWWTGKEGTQAVYNPTLDKKLREKRPHSSPEGRMRDVKTAYAKAAEESKQRKWTRKTGRAGPRTRTKKGVGGIAKIIGKKAVDWIKKNRKTIRKEVYSPEGKKKTKDMLDKLKKKYPDSQMFGPKKAKGGPVRPIDIPWPKKRVKKGHGGSAQSHYLQHGYGPTKVKLRSGKPKIAKKGW